MRGFALSAEWALQRFYNSLEDNFTQGWYAEAIPGGAVMTVVLLYNTLYNTLYDRGSDWLRKGVRSLADSIVIVEDDEGIRAMLRYYFVSVGYAVRDYDSGEALFAAEAGSLPPTLYILDIMLPGMDGVEILRRLRADPAAGGVPVIFLTARTAEMDRVGGLEAGADDYVVKPFSVMELQARVKAVLRRTAGKEGRILRCEELEIDRAAREVRKNGVDVELTYKEFELLCLLVAHRGEAMTREEILRRVWGYDYTGETRTVDMHVKTLRQKLGEDLVTTVRGVGYKIR